MKTQTYHRKSDIVTSLIEADATMTIASSNMKYPQFANIMQRESVDEDCASTDTMMNNEIFRMESKPGLPRITRNRWQNNMPSNRIS